MQNGDDFSDSRGKPSHDGVVIETTGDHASFRHQPKHQAEDEDHDDGHADPPVRSKLVEIAGRGQPVEGHVPHDGHDEPGEWRHDTHDATAGSQTEGQAQSSHRGEKWVTE